MKKRLTALLIALSLILSLTVISVSAEEETTKQIACFDIDSLELENGGNIYDKTNSNGSAEGYRAYFTYNSSGYFLQLYRSSDENVNYYTYREDDFYGQTAQIAFNQSSADKSAQLRFLINSVNANKNETALAVRTANVAYSFDLKIPSGLSLKASVQGLPSTSNSLSEGSYLTSTLFEITATGTTVKTSSYTKDTTSSPTTKSYTDTLFKRGEYVNFKTIIDYDNGTFDLYINNHLVSSGNGLAGTKFLSDFLLYIGHPKDNDSVNAYIDNLSYYTLCEEDLKQVYVSDSIADGTLSLNETFTQVGKPVTFTAIPNDGYKLTDVTLDGKSVEGLNINRAGGTYTIESLPYGGELKAIFEKKRLTTEVANFDIDSLGLENGTGIANKTSYNLNNSAYFLYATTTGNGKLTVDGTENQVLKVYGAKGAYSAGTFTFLRNDLNTNRTDKQKELRTNDIALTFKLKLHTGTAMTLSVKGLSSTATMSKNSNGYWLPDSGFSFMESTILSCGRSGTGGFINSYKKDSTAEADIVKTNLDNIVTRDEWVTYKLLFDYDEGTFDVYINDYLKLENCGLAGVQYLSDFKINIHHQSGYSNSFDIEAYLDDMRMYSLAEEDTNLQTSVEKSGKGSVTSDKFLIADNDIVNYTITPDEGSYIRNVYFNGKAIPAFNSEGITFTTPKINSANSLKVVFSDYTSGSPVVMITPLRGRIEDTSYIYCKLLANNTDVSSYGLLVSRTNETPSLDDESTKMLPFYGAVTENGEALSSKGYFGFALVSKEAEETDSFYVRPYAKVGDRYVFGTTAFIEPSELEVIE